MSEAYLIAASQGPVSPLSGKSYAEQIAPLVKNALGSSSSLTRRVQELQWVGGEETNWFPTLIQQAALPLDLIAFHWPLTPVLAHTLLQSLSRSLESGERDLILLGQQTGDQAIVLLLGSPTAVGRHNLAPRARLGARFAFSRQPDGYLKAARSAMEKAELDLSNLHFFASSARFSPGELKTVLPSAQPLNPGSDLVSGDLFLLNALVTALEESRQDQGQGLLFSPAAHGSAIATLIERL